MRTGLLVFCLTLLTIGCVYPRRGTSITPVRNPRSAAVMDAPPNVWELTVVGAQVRPRRPGDLSWDDSGGLPDVFVRIYRNEEQIWESETVEDTLTPEWNVVLPRNFRAGATDYLRVEVWDADGVGADPVGIYRNQGLPPTALPGADARLLLEGGSYVTIRVNPPRAHRGLGVEEYVVKPDELEVVRVMAFSPAGRAGLEPGDRIIAVGDQRIADLSDAQAASALSMAVTRHSSLTVRRGEGPERVVDIDDGYVWLTM